MVYLAHGVGATHAAPVAREILEAYFGRRSPPSASAIPATGSRATRVGVGAGLGEGAVP